MALTPKQTRLISEIAELYELFGMDVERANSIKKGIWRTSYLESVKRQIVRGQVIHWYTYMDEMLGCRIAWYFFGKSKTFQALWRTKRFQRFNHYILDEQSLLQKLRLGRAIESIPKSVVEDIERLNALRNGMAHSFFPENRRASNTQWKGENILSIAGAKTMSDDMATVFSGLDAYAPKWGRVWKPFE